MGVPAGLTEEFDQFRLNMKGTNKKHHARCQALEGKIGADARCSIYSLRPSPCRAFTASYEDGRQNPRCDQARARYGFAPPEVKGLVELSEFCAPFRKRFLLLCFSP